MKEHYFEIHWNLYITNGDDFYLDHGPTFDFDASNPKEVIDNLTEYILDEYGDMWGYTLDNLKDYLTIYKISEVIEREKGKDWDW